MKRVLFTGGTGFIGKNVLPELRKNSLIFAPKREELNLYDLEEIKRYVSDHNIDVIVHSANPNPVKNSVDKDVSMLKGSLQIFMNFYEMQDAVEKILYIGSGAEYDKRYDISSVSEEEIGIHIPTDEYGFAKYIMNELARKSKNIYNLRLFACYGPYDFYTKFITHVIHCCLKGEDVTIRQDCWFDYLHVDDLGKIIHFFMYHNLKYHDYNVCSGERVMLSSLAKEVMKQMGYSGRITFGETGFNKEYTGNNSRLLSEYTGTGFVDIKEGISRQITWEKRQMI